MRKGFFRYGFVGLSSLALSLVSLAACKQGRVQAAHEATAPTQAEPSPSAHAPSTPGSSAEAPHKAPSTSETKTTALGNDGDLQGARLGDSLHSKTESKGPSGPPSTHGQSANEPGRSTADIQALVASHRDEARACYDKALAEHPGMEGTLDIKWVIDPQGNVVDAGVDTTKSDILEPSVGACIVQLITKIRFAPTAKGYETRVHYPFKFAPRRGQRKDAGA
jgi:outer membrane biosynthesis protein TonB